MAGCGSNWVGDTFTTAGSVRELCRLGKDGFTSGFTSFSLVPLGILLITLECLSASRLFAFVVGTPPTLPLEKLVFADKCFGPETVGLAEGPPLSCPRFADAKREYKGVSALANGAGAETEGFDLESIDSFLSLNSRFMKFESYRGWILRG